MSTYHKIQTVFKRDPATKHKTLLFGDYSLPEFEYLASNEWVFTEKVDGTNIRVYFENGGVRFGGRTDRAQIPEPLLERLRERFMPLAGDFNGLCLYGEGYGPKIQKVGENYREDQDFVLFDVLAGDWWLGREDIVGIAEKMGIDVVPVIGSGTLNDMVQAAADGIVSRWGDFQSEGIVARPATELKARSGARIITKIKCRDFR